MKLWLFFTLVCSSFLFGAEFHLKERLEKAKNGDYVVMEANKMITILAIRAKTQQTFILEEITAPLQNLKKMPASWAEWVRAKAPGHTSWSMVEIDLKNAQVLECYSFSRSSWVQLSQKESLFATLLDLPMKPIDASKRKKIGPSPMEGEPDIRKVWNPPLVFEGKKVDNALFDVFETEWPDDGSELSNKELSVYFDREKRFPLPFWIQLETSHATVALRTIDSGKNLPIMHRNLPRRVPEFIGLPQKIENGLRLSLKSPKYYRQFELFVIDVTTKEKQIYPLTHTLIHADEEFLTLEVSDDDLNQTLQQDHRYTWLVVPLGHSESYTESIKPFVWNPDKN
jgi:hypothetical protein